MEHPSYIQSFRCERKTGHPILERWGLKICSGFSMRMLFVTSFSSIYTIYFGVVILCVRIKMSLTILLHYRKFWEYVIVKWTMEEDCVLLNEYEKT